MARPVYFTQTTLTDTQVKIVQKPLKLISYTRVAMQSPVKNDARGAA